MAPNPIPPDKKEFRYTPEEAQRIADTLPDVPQNIDEDRDWKDILGEPSRQDYEKDKSGIIARHLSHHFKHILEDNINPSTGGRLPNKAEDLATVDRIAHMAKQMHKELIRPNSYRTKYALAFLGRDKFAVERETRSIISTDQVLLQALKEIEENHQDTRDHFSSWHDDNRVQVTNYNRSRALFVELLCQYWEGYTGQPPAKSRSGGRTAKFVFEAINPVLIFMHNGYGKIWHRSIPLKYHSQAAEMIASYQENSAGN